MNSLEQYLQEKLNAIEKAKWTRNTTPQRPLNTNQRLINGKELLQFCSNDYLGLSQDERILEAAYQAGQDYGHGSTGSRLITGTTDLHQELEGRFAAFKAKPASLYMNSGYIANLAVISTLMGPRDIIFSDQYNHASIKKGSELSGAEIIEYSHNDMSDLESLLKESRTKGQNALIVSDVIFSMDGDSASLKELLSLAEEYNCWLMLDEAHSTGIYGAEGRGLVHQELYSHPLYPQIIQITTCSKALGLQGAFITGPTSLISYLSQRASAFIYSTAASPMLIGGLLKSIEITQIEANRREQLWANRKALLSFLRANNISHLPTNSPIVCLPMPDNTTALTISEELRAAGMWIQAIRPPTVPSPRLRITLSALHTDQDLEKLFQALTELNQIQRKFDNI